MNKQEKRLSSRYNFEILEVIYRCEDDMDPNHNAWCYLLSSITPFDWESKKRHIRKGNIENSIYPLTMEECNEMSEKLVKAELNQKVYDERFSDILKEVRHVVEWSKQKHFNIVTFLVACFLLSFSLSENSSLPKDAERWQMNLDCVNTWDDKDTTLTIEEAYSFDYPSSECLNSPTIAKYYYLYDVAKHIYWDSLRVKAGTCSEEDVAQAKIRLDDNIKEFNRRNAMTTTELKKELIIDYEDRIKEAQKPSERVKMVIFFFSILYLFSCYEYGYNINRFTQPKRNKNSLLNFNVFFPALMFSNTYGSRRITKEEANTEANVKFGFLALWLCLKIAIVFAVLIKTPFQNIYYNYIEPWKKIHSDKIYATKNMNQRSASYYLKNIANVISRGYINTFTFEGRDSRLQYLFFFVVNMILLIPLLFLVEVSSYVLPFVLLFMLASVSTTVRRLHDMGKTGEYGLLLPFLGMIGFAILLMFKGNKEDNEYGEVPESVF